MTFVKIRELIDRKLSLEIDEVTKVYLDLEVEGLTIHNKNENKVVKAYIIDETTHKTKNNLETLWYNFKVGI